MKKKPFRDCEEDGSLMRIYRLKYLNQRKQTLAVDGGKKSQRLEVMNGVEMQETGLCLVHGYTTLNQVFLALVADIPCVTRCADSLLLSYSRACQSCHGVHIAKLAAQSSQLFFKAGHPGKLTVCRRTPTRIQLAKD